MAQVMIDETIPLFYKLPVESGGLGWNEAQIGKLLTIGGIANILFCLGPLVWMQRKVGTLGIHRLGLVLVTPFFAGWWLVSALEPIIGSAGVWVLSCLLISIRAWGLTLSFTAAFIMINNSVERHNLGKANAFGQMASSCCRSLAPVVMGLTWGVGIRRNHIGIPFFLLGVLFAVQYLASLCVDPELDRARVRNGNRNGRSKVNVEEG